MIDRSSNRLHFCFRRGTLRAALLISAGLFSLLPVAGLLCVIGGGVALAACLVAMTVLGIGGMLLFTGGIMAFLFGMLGGGDEATGGGVLAGVAGGAGLALFEFCHRQVLEAGETALAACCHAAGFLLMHVFWGQWVFLWSWALLALAIISVLVVLLLIAVLRGESFFKSRFCGIRYTCPTGHERGLPLFRCPKCSSPVSDLVPSVYGIFSAHCAQCQEKIPTMDCLGRVTLDKVCPSCSADFSHPAIGKSREVHLAVVGAESSGKTTVLFAALWQVARLYGPKAGCQIDFGNQQQKRKVNESIKTLAAGHRLPKTPSVRRPPALNVAIRSAGQDASLLYLYDAAGADFTNETQMIGHGFHRFLDGVLLVIDPFAEAFSRPNCPDAADRQAWSKVHPAVTGVASVFAPFLNRLEQQTGLSAEGVFSIPVAVVVTKTGCFPRRLLRESATSRTGNAEGERMVIRDFLLDLGLANLIAGLESRFRNVAYFATSAAEEASASGASVRPRAAKPLLWLMGQTGALSGKRLKRVRHESKFSRTILAQDRL